MTASARSQVILTHDRIGRVGVMVGIGVLLLAAAYPRSLQSQEAHVHPTAPSSAQSTGRAAVGDLSIPAGIELVNQDGETVHFKRDLVQGKVVAINTIFTTCTTICPTMGIFYSQLQREEFLGERVGRDVNLISITIDPATDTPERLKAWSVKLGARPGWTLLTGNQAEVQDLLKELNLYASDKESHVPLVLIGDDSTRSWRYVNGAASPRVLADAINAALQAR